MISISELFFTAGPAPWGLEGADWLPFPQQPLGPISSSAERPQPPLLCTGEKLCLAPEQALCFWEAAGLSVLLRLWCLQSMPCPALQDAVAVAGCLPGAASWQSRVPAVGWVLSVPGAGHGLGAGCLKHQPLPNQSRAEAGLMS